ncbi:hypothetical protein LTR10_021397 [Elasticomyces elasticus]|nr:hypothetical protein LTR10_021397 [Elasticomyces elasticus]KAK4971785.1 hypothetical protein LTR42_007513 [Elasticomyces elasticus]
MFKEAMKLSRHVLSASHAFDDVSGFAREFCKLPNSSLLILCGDQMLHLQYTLGREIGGTPSFVQKYMAPALPAMLPGLTEEVALAWESQLCPVVASADGSPSEVNLIRAVSGVRASALIHELAVVSIVLDYTPACLRRHVVSLSGFYKDKDKLKKEMSGTVTPVVSAALRDHDSPAMTEVSQEQTRSVKRY